MIKVTLGIIWVLVFLFLAEFPVYGEIGSSNEDKSNKMREKAMLEALAEAKRMSIAKAQVKEDPVQEVVTYGIPIKDENETSKESRREVQVETKRAGHTRYYKSGEGFKITPFLGVASRMEIFEEPNPLDDYILEAKELNRDSKSRRNEMITPLFTRAFAGQVIFDQEDWPRLTYTFDRRTVLHEFQIKYGIKDQNWQTQEFSILHSLPRLKYIGILTLNPVYKRIALSSEDDTNTAEDRDEYILNFTMTPMETLEIFGQLDYYEGKKLNTPWVSKPEQRLYRVELRKDFPRFKLKLTPGYSHSQVEYKPALDTFTKQEIYLDIGKAMTNRLRSSSKIQLVLSENDWSGRGTSNIDAEVFSLENKLSYELFKDIDISTGLNYFHGVGFNAFDNYSLVGEMQIFKPGILRCVLGYNRTEYFNLDNSLNLFYFKIYFFM